jgi:hypothetical protein
MLGIRVYVESLLPYIEALPFTKLLRDFWDVNHSRQVWWSDNLSGIPGTGSIPPGEHLDLFIQECLLEEKAIKSIEESDHLALQVAGVSAELASSLQKSNQDLIKARSQQINYMLFKEVPELKTEPDGSFALPTEASREELISVAESMLRGKMDYHDLMLTLMKKRKELLKKHQERVENRPLPKPPPKTKEDAFEGGSFYATPTQVAAMKARGQAERDMLDRATLEFSLEAVESITKNRKRDMLIQGIDPYHEDDQSVDFGTAERIIRNSEIT